VTARQSWVFELIDFVGLAREARLALLRWGLFVVAEPGLIPWGRLGGRSHWGISEGPRITGSPLGWERSATGARLSSGRLGERSEDEPHADHGIL